MRKSLFNVLKEIENAKRFPGVLREVVKWDTDLGDGNIYVIEAVCLKDNSRASSRPLEIISESKKGTLLKVKDKLVRISGSMSPTLKGALIGAAAVPAALGAYEAGQSLQGATLPTADEAGDWIWEKGKKLFGYDALEDRLKAPIPKEDVLDARIRHAASSLNQIPELQKELGRLKEIEKALEKQQEEIQNKIRQTAASAEKIVSDVGGAGVTEALFEAYKRVLKKKKAKKRR